MALPVIDKSVSLDEATRRIVRFLRDTEGIDRVFKVEAIRALVHKESLTRREYLEYTINMYK